MKIYLLMVLIMVTTNIANAESIMFSDESTEQRWFIVNDTVMGGRSDSNLIINGNSVIFSGKLSLENYGGFASTRYILPKRYPDKTKLVINVLGDGRVYQVRLRTDDNIDGIAYKIEFQTKVNSWQTLTFNIEDFIATYRGRNIVNAPRLLSKNVAQIGFLIADKKLEPFKLRLKDMVFLP